jgi:subfamily B ATP-binding cassette protein MsbA
VHHQDKSGGSAREDPGPAGPTNEPAARPARRGRRDAAGAAFFTAGDTDEPVQSSRPDAPRRFWKFLRRYRGLIVVASLGNVFTVFLVLLVPLFAKFVIDEAIPGKNTGLLVGLAAGLFLLQALRFVVGYGHHYLTNYIGQRTVFDIRRTLFNHLQLLHLAFYEKKRTASLVNRVIHDAAAIQQFINSAFNTVANSLVIVVLSLGIMFWLNAPLALFCAACLPVYFVVVRSFRRRLAAGHHEVKERQSLLAGKLGETFAGIRVVKSFAQEDHERKRFVLTIKDNFYSELALPLLGLRMQNALGLMFFFVYCTCMVVMGMTAIDGGTTIGGYVAFTAYLWMLFGPIEQLSNLLQASTNARTGFERILSLLDTKPAIREDDNPLVLPAMRGRVQFDHVDFSYDGRPALRDFCLDVAPGEIIALVGHSGSGKSTLMSLLTRFYDVSGGRILIDGTDLRRLKYDAYRQQLGIVLQENFLFSGTVEENIRYGRPDASRDEVVRAARLANALEFIEEMPRGFESHVGQGGVTLSGGQRQRLAIARCILKDPRILIFDEATSALDTRSEALIQASLDTLMDGRTVFIVAHRLSTIRKADRIVVMGHGRILETGTHAELLDRRGAYFELNQPKAAADPVALPA